MTEPNEKIDVFVDVELSDLLRAQYWFVYRKPWMIFAHIVGLVFAGVYIPIALTGNVKLDSLPSIFAFAYIAAFFVLPISIYFNMKRHFSNLKAYQKKVQYSFSNSGLNISDEKSYAHNDWDSILKVVETKHNFNLFYLKSFFRFIPKRCFQNEMDLQLLRGILKWNLGDKAQVFEGQKASEYAK